MNAAILSPNYYLNDSAFDSIFPDRIQKLSKVHWTPLAIARKAATFLAPAAGTRILDIGSGIGKFCFAGAHYCPDSEFYGVEQRSDLVNYAMMAKEVSETRNVHFIHGNFTQLDFDNYDSIYFYNSFGENLFGGNLTRAHIDESIDHSFSLYMYYSNYLFRVLENKPIGTRLATFHGCDSVVPSSYDMIEHHMERALKLWIRR